MAAHLQTEGCWRGTVGILRAHPRPGGIETLIRLLPAGIGVIPLHLGADAPSFDHGHDIAAYERQLATLAQLQADAIFVADPALFQIGFKQEQETLVRWRKQFGAPVSSHGSAQLNAMRALGIRRVVGLSWAAPAISDSLAAYFADAGVTPLEIATIEAKQSLADSPEALYRRVRRILARHERAEGLYLAGAGPELLDVATTIEMDFGLPVIHPICAQSWEIQRRLRIRQPLPDRGVLLREMPRLPEHATSRVRPAD